MKLRDSPARARSEEDVKDAYIDALALSDPFKGQVDIKTDALWFEAKWTATPPLVMLAQLLVYIHAARSRGEPIPGHLAIIDREKAAIVATETMLPVFDDPDIVWPKAASAAGPELAAQIAPYAGALVTYDVASHEQEFIDAVKSVVSEGRVIRTPITPANVRQVFDRWVEMIGSELGVANPAHYAGLGRRIVAASPPVSE